MKISAVIPTCEKQWDEGMTFRSLPNLNRKPNEIVVVMDSDEEAVEEQSLAGVPVKVLHTRLRGAAAKRNLGVARSSGEAILFVDDDVEFQSECLEFMEKTLVEDEKIGGVGCFIENQAFREPGLYSRMVYRLVGGWGIREFGGSCFGPMITMHPRPWNNGVLIKDVEWLNSGCVMYKKAALPFPAFEKNFTGYSFMEDVALSRRVRKKWRIVVSRDAWIFHHTHPAPYKNEVGRLHQMGIENRYHNLVNVEKWSKLKAATVITWLEILTVPVKFRNMIALPQGWKAFQGSARGLAHIWIGACSDMLKELRRHMS